MGRRTAAKRAGLGRFDRSRAKRTRLAVGLISGTSVDAIEAVVCRVRGTGADVQLSLLGHLSHPFTPGFSQRILGTTGVRDLCAMNFVLGELFAEAARAVIEASGLKPAQIDVIGSHGQTMAHLEGATLQIAEAAVIAERTGVPVVADFRVRDVAVGGQGAPLVPYCDWALFRKRGATRALQNIGGIANVSVVSDRLEDTIAFDTGPGNMLIDSLVRLSTQGQRTYDRDGLLAGQGTVIAPLLHELMKHSFLRRPPPRSAGRDQFGEALAQDLWKRFRRRPNDLIATATAFTVEATVDAYRRFVLPGRKLEGVYVSGGGGRNPKLMGGLTDKLAPIAVHPLEALGFPEGAKEAACFALLACEFLSGTAQNVPRATGARLPVVLGKLTP